MEIDIIYALSVIGSIFAIVPIFELFKYVYNKNRQKKNFFRLLTEANLSYRNEKYEDAFTKYYFIIQNFDEKISYFNFGQIYSSMGHCLISNISHTKDWNKITEGIEYFEKSLLIFNIYKYPLKSLVFGIDNIIMNNFIIQKIFNILKFDKNRIFIKILDKLKLCRYIFRFAGTKMDLGIAYCRLAEIRNPIENYEKAITYYQEALQIYTFERFPIDNKRATENLISTSLHLGKLKDREKYCDFAKELSLELYKNIQKKPNLFNAREGTLACARAQFGAGNYLMEFFERSMDIEFWPDKKLLAFIKGSIDCYLSALNFYTVENYPHDFGMIQNNLGISYSHLSFIEDTQKNSQIAIEAFKNALIIRTKEKYPIEYAQTMHNWGHLCGKLGQIEKEDDKRNHFLNSSIEKFKNALSIRTIENYPIEFAETQGSIAVSYFLIGSLYYKNKNMKKEILWNLKESISSLNWSLRVFVKEKYAVDYSHLQFLKGKIYTFLADIENRESNLIEANVAYKEAESIEKTAEMSKLIEENQQKLNRQ